MSDWSSENLLQPIINDLRRYFSIQVIENDILKNKLSFLGQFYIPGIRLPEQLGLSFLKIEKNKQGETRLGLLYTLKRIS